MTPIKTSGDFRSRSLPQTGNPSKSLGLLTSLLRTSTFSLALPSLILSSVPFSRSLLSNLKISINPCYLQTFPLRRFSRLLRGERVQTWTQVGPTEGENVLGRDVGSRCSRGGLTSTFLESRCNSRGKFTEWTGSSKVFSIKSSCSANTGCCLYRCSDT